MEDVDGLPGGRATFAAGRVGRIQEDFGWHG